MVAWRRWMLTLVGSLPAGLALLGCEPRQGVPLSGGVSFEYVGWAGTGLEATLANGSSKEIGFRGKAAESDGAFYAWDSEIRCDSPGHHVMSVHGPVIVPSEGVSYVRVSPGEKVQVIFRRGPGADRAGSRCHLRLRLADGATLDALGEFELAAAEPQPPVDDREFCKTTRDAFVKEPEQVMEVLQASPECWPEIAASDDAFAALAARVSKGDLGAVKYLVPHLSELDGAKAEDVTVALGEFSDHHMTEFLDLVQSGVLDSRHMADAVGVLNPDIGDDYQEQLARLRKRRLAAEDVSDPTLDSYRKAAITAIDAAIKQTQRTIPSTSRDSSAPHR